jgi:hypothetical protein
MKNFFLIKHHPRGLTKIYQENPASNVTSQTHALYSSLSRTDGVGLSFGSFLCAVGVEHAIARIGQYCDRQNLSSTILSLSA